MDNQHFMTLSTDRCTPGDWPVMIDGERRVLPGAWYITLPHVETGLQNEYLVVLTSVSPASWALFVNGRRVDSLEYRGSAPVKRIAELLQQVTLGYLDNLG